MRGHCLELEVLLAIEQCNFDGSTFFLFEETTTTPYYSFFILLRNIDYYGGKTNSVAEDDSRA